MELPQPNVRVNYFAAPLAVQRDKGMAEKLTPTERLRMIAAIIENVDDRCMAADGPVTPTLHEMTQREMSHIYELATGKRESSHAR